MKGPASIPVTWHENEAPFEYQYHVRAPSLSLFSTLNTAAAAQCSWRIIPMTVNVKIFILRIPHCCHLRWAPPTRRQSGFSQLFKNKWSYIYVNILCQIGNMKVCSLFYRFKLHNIFSNQRWNRFLKLIFKLINPIRRQGTGISYNLQVWFEWWLL